MNLPLDGACVNGEFPGFISAASDMDRERLDLRRRLLMEHKASRSHDSERMLDIGTVLKSENKAAVLCEMCV